MSVELDIKLEANSLNRFLLYHNYARFSGIIGVVISLAAAAALAVRWEFWTQPQRTLLFVLALLFTAIQPVMLISKGKRQLSMEEFKIPFHYVFDEKGITISQKDQKQEFTWGDVRRIVYRKDAVYVYMSTVSAFIIPEDQCDGRFGDLVNLMKEKKAK